MVSAATAGVPSAAGVATTEVSATTTEVSATTTERVTAAAAE